MGRILRLHLSRRFCRSAQPPPTGDGQKVEAAKGGRQYRNCVILFCVRFTCKLISCSHSQWHIDWLIKSNYNVIVCTSLDSLLFPAQFHIRLKSFIVELYIAISNKQWTVESPFYFVSPFPRKQITKYATKTQTRTFILYSSSSDLTGSVSGFIETLFLSRDKAFLISV